ncbi:beta-xylanase [Neptunitalea chrysea]|uniref:Beta-xylanase n=2 Tax=Neptunitalea chrysea TaxID=1647581 RepID=A0A9W6B853_9FLAO|nr:beta-xylanase [Neptunitalea chrysea]
MPNSKGMKLQHIEERERITQVATPGIYAFYPAPEEANGAAVLICPGGGYHHLTYNLGGFQLAKWLNTQGIAAFVLIYRLPTSPDLKDRILAPVQDAQRAMQLIRFNAEKWNIDTNKLGIMGTSAGGHLASILGTHTENVTHINDTISTLPFKPDYMLLVSPVISMESETHKGSVENLLGKNANDTLKHRYSTYFQVTEDTPPTFLAHAENDPAVPVSNSLRFYMAMVAHNVPSTLHVFPTGEHAIGTYNASELTNQWKQLCILWLKEIRIITKKN